jgi:hypothetical protein
MIRQHHRAAPIVMIRGRNHKDDPMHMRSLLRQKPGAKQRAEKKSRTDSCEHAKSSHAPSRRANSKRRKALPKQGRSQN